MTIREEIEAREARELSPHACLSTSSKGREREEEPCPGSSTARHSGG